jgi:uncharacterized protein YdeI (YjbR/CyaY-like superfamily)
MAAGRDLPIMHFESPEAWESWLDQQHCSSGGVWLKIAKKGSQASSVSYQEALEVAICYGWRGMRPYPAAQSSAALARLRRPRCRRARITLAVP